MRTSTTVTAGVLVLVLASTAQAAAPPVGPLMTARGGPGGEDLILSWTPPAMPVDGYRVYRSDDIACNDSQPIYLGTTPSFTVTGAFLDPAFALYRVTSLVGTDESEPSPPAYKFSMYLPQPRLWGWSEHLLAMPYHSGVTEGAQWCTDLNGAVRVSSPVSSVHLWESSTATYRTRACVSGLGGPPLVPGDANFVTLDQVTPGLTAYLWGSAPEDWTVPLPEILQHARESTAVLNRLNLYAVSLPYDHDYPDLEAVAADLPLAVAIRVNDLEYVCNAFPCPFIGRGLLRTTSSDPWTGTNVQLDPHRGEGLIIGVDIPTTWTIRRQCTGPITGGCVGSLLASRRGDDVELYWDTAPTAGAMRYDIYRVETVEDLADLDAQPVYRSVSAAPSFPVVDIGVVASPAQYFYAVRAR